MKRFLTKLRCLMFLMVALLALAGCGGEEETPEPVTPVPPANKPTPPKPPPKEPKKPIKPVKVEDTLEQHLQLTLGGGNDNSPIESEKCYARLVLGVLELSSYDTDEPSKYPAVYVRCNVGADTSTALKGKTFDAQVYLLMDKDAAPFHTPDGSLLKLTITDVSDTIIAAELAEGTLTNAKTEARVLIKGTFGAEIK